MNPNPNPYPYPPPGVPAPGQPPPLGGGLQALGIIQIIYGAICACSPLGQVVQRVVPTTPMQQRLQEAMWQGVLGAWLIASMVVTVLSSGAVLATGIGVLKRKAWARRLGVGWSIAIIAWTVVAQIISFAVIMPMTMEIMEKQMGGAIPPEMMGFVRAAGGVGGVIGALLGLALPVATLIVLTRPSAKAKLVA